MKTFPSLPELAKDLRSQKIRSEDLVCEANKNYQATEEKLNAYKTWGGERALEQARAVDTLLKDGIDLGPLMGIPVSVKDLYGVPGLPVFAGSQEALPEAWEKAGPVVKALQQQLGIVVGKSHTVEFAFGGLGVNPHWGTPFNPWSPDEHKIPGGSSSGAGVSLVQGSALLAFGSDTAGSIRIPASVTGQVGLKLTHGIWPLEGIVPLSPSLDTPGLICRSVEDAAFAYIALDNLICPSSSAPCPLEEPMKALPLPAVRFGFPTNMYWDETDKDIADLVKSALACLVEQGAQTNDCVLPGVDEVLEIFRMGGLAAPEFQTFLNMELPEKREKLAPIVQRRLQSTEDMKAEEYLRRKHLISVYSNAALSVFESCDVVITPTVAISPPSMKDLEDVEKAHISTMMVLRNTAVVNFLSCCAISIPLGLDNKGMPVGLQLMAAPYQEEALLAIGLSVEKCLKEHFAPRKALDEKAKSCMKPYFV